MELDSSTPVWHYVDSDNSPKGPFSFRDIDALLRTSEFSLSTLIWKEGFDNWKPIRTVVEFIDSFAEDDADQALHTQPLLELPKIILPQKNPAKREKQREKKRAKWYTPKINTNLYITGLPPGITTEKMHEFFSKAGVIRIDKFTSEPKIKLYNNTQGTPKGDGLVSYAKTESLSLAITMLNHSEIEPGRPITVEPADFKQKGEYIPRKKIKVDKLQLLKAKAKRDELLSWDDDGSAEGLRVVILSNVFSPDDLTDQGSREEFRERLLKNITEQVGALNRIWVHETHPEGLVEIRFKKPASAKKCIELWENKEFFGRTVHCEYWDGKTDYKRPRESAEQQQKRIEDFGKWLEESSSDQEVTNMD